MKIYVNGDSHAAAAEAVNPHAFAEDDSQYFYMGRAPHPENWRVSSSRILGDTLKCIVHCDAESASSNQRIRRTTRAWIARNQRWLPETVILIQWSTWEREEWWIDDRCYQVTASGIDDVPPDHQDRYRRWVIDVDWDQCRDREHQEIWLLHQELEAHGVRHIFYNGNNHFGEINPSARRDWSANYIGAYDPDLTYDSWLRRNGHTTVSPDSWHFGKEAHAAWAGFLLQYGIQHGFWR
jgi:hypothetical protein